MQNSNLTSSLKLGAIKPLSANSIESLNSCVIKNQVRGNKFEEAEEHVHL